MWEDLGANFLNLEIMKRNKTITDWSGEVSLSPIVVVLFFQVSPLPPSPFKNPSSVTEYGETL